MPARAERIYLFPAEEGQPGQVMRFPIWWERRGFFKKYRDREIDLGHPLYVDYAFLLTAWEALEWDKLCRKQFSSQPGSKMPKVVSDMQRIESALKKAKWVIVESYEWESGLD
jgi:hypothetical protein